MLQANCMGRKKAPTQGKDFQRGFDPRRNLKGAPVAQWNETRRALRQLTLDRIRQFLHMGNDLKTLVDSGTLNNLEYIVARYIIRLRNELRDADFEKFLGLLGIEYQDEKPMLNVQINNNAQIESMTDNELEAEVKKLQGDKNEKAIDTECKRIESGGTPTGNVSGEDGEPKGD